jgi:hypothetical protein
MLTINHRQLMAVLTEHVAHFNHHRRRHPHTTSEDATGSAG